MRAMREEFVDPLPTDPANATLLFGKSPVACYIVETTDIGFRVAVPGVGHYEGDPKLTLATEEGAYPVRLVLQEPHAGGYSYRLKRLDLVAPPADPQPQKSRLWNPYYCALGIGGVIVAGLLCVPAVNESIPLLNIHQSQLEVLSWWANVTGQHQNVDSSSSVKKQGTGTKIAPKSQFDDLDDFSTISVSLVSPASRPVAAAKSQSADEKDKTRNRAASDHTAKALSLKAVLEEGQRGLIRTATRANIPWLYEADQSDSELSLRLSEKALFDLRQFELGLRRLPKETSTEAITSLKETLLLASRGDDRGRRVPGMRDVFVLASDDAKIYFRTEQGQLELVRVLPLDFNKAD